MIVTEDQYLKHYGILRRSGRYPWGSGGSQTARNRKFLDTIEDMRKEGMTNAQIAKAFHTPEHPFTTNTLLALKTIALNEQKQQQINMAQRLKDKGMGNSAIGERMGINESTVRSLLAPGRQDKLDVLNATADMLRKQVAEKEFVDIGAEVERSLPLGDNPAAQIGIARTKFDTAVAMLKEEGYTTHNVDVIQQGTGHKTKRRILAKPGVTQKDAWMNRDKIQLITDHSDNGGRTWTSLRKPTSVSSKKVAVRYAEDGGAHADGVIFVRPGVKDLDMGASSYAQVRILVDGTHYLKGMAVYKKDLPPGVDLVFNTNKSNTGNKLDALKKIEPDPLNPFGSSIKRQSGHLNIVKDEGDWDKFSKSLPSQMLAKQSPDLAKTQLDVTYERRHQELKEIMALNNPSVRAKLLESFSDDADAAAVHLKAAAMPRQESRVIMPVKSMKDQEVYAPTFRDGTRVALVRFPHGGTFEIPQLTVNNKNKEAKSLLGNARDAIGINAKVAERLSGADFDGDHVLVIPNNKGDIKSTPALEGLKGFDPRRSYPKYDGMIPIDAVAGRDQDEMGKITNLIADMTVQGAPAHEVARAVRHSMVIIDAKKHELDYKSSFQDNGIPALKKKYQGGERAGAATLLTRAGAEARPFDRKPRPASEGGPIDKKTGKKVFVETGRTYVNNKGQTVRKTVRSKRLAETDDATTLLSGDGTGTRIERIYADHSNKLKALANTARKEMVNTQTIPYSPSAKKVYANEVASLNAKLNIARKNAPLERQAQSIAEAIVRQTMQANPGMDDDEKKKLRRRAQNEGRLRMGAKKDPVRITQSEWDAIQAGAISKSKLDAILKNADIDEVKKLATPKPKLKMSTAKQAQARLLLSRGYTQAEVADKLGVSVSTLNLSLDEGGAYA